uniref:Uncharacterized protein n=2 Tax=Oryza TaxID=4527 RepID=Q109K2_ORYSJ|nr:hypothetical protein LOC_Os10g33204 [Oryza sativa Japonica Group]
MATYGRRATSRISVACHRGQSIYACDAHRRMIDRLIKMDTETRKRKIPPESPEFYRKTVRFLFKNREKGILVKKENCIWRTQHEGIRFCRREYAFQSSSPIITLNKLPAAGRRLVRRWPPSVWSGQVSMILQRENASQLWRRLATDRQADRPENYSLAPEASNAFGR